VVDTNNQVICPSCNTPVNVGKVGIQNYYKRHQNSEKCKENKKKYRAEQVIKRTKKAAHHFFAPRKPCAPIPPTIFLPPPVHAAPLNSTSGLQSSEKPGTVAPSGAPVGCSVALGLLSKFRARIERLPLEVGEAGHDHPLAQFSGDPTGCVGEDEDTWEKFDRPLNTVLQKPPEELRALVRLGERGLIGLHQLLEYLVSHHGIKGALIEMKLERLMHAMDEVYVKRLLAA
jgi:hypothetical protein